MSRYRERKYKPRGRIRKARIRSYSRVVKPRKRIRRMTDEEIKERIRRR